MDLVQKALWFIEIHSEESTSLEAIARACHFSPFHLTRAFAASTGLSLMRDVRGRRLSEAARRLAQGTYRIIDVALGSGYGSHEEFTRAFREQFGLTPEQVRLQGHIHSINLAEAIPMEAATTRPLDAPRFDTRAQIVFAGLSERYDCHAVAGIPKQWQRFTPYLGRIPGQAGQVAYGVCSHFDAEGCFDDMTGVEITGSPDLPKALATLQVPPQDTPCSCIAATWPAFVPR